MRKVHCTLYTFALPDKYLPTEMLEWVSWQFVVNQSPVYKARGMSCLQ